MADSPSVAGALAAHPLASALALEVERVHRRYAAEVVQAFSLCPHMNDPATAFGRFCVVFDREPERETACALVLAAPGVVHLVYPLYEGSCHEFERFANSLHEAVRRAAEARGDSAQRVHAAFHPAMAGDASNPSRAIGLLRRAPDPFVQFVPDGLSSATGTAYLDPASLDLRALLSAPVPAPVRSATLDAASLSAIAAAQADIRCDRDASYARFVDAM